MLLVSLMGSSFVGGFATGMDIFVNVSPFRPSSEQEMTPFSDHTLRPFYLRGALS